MALIDQASGAFKPETRCGTKRRSPADANSERSVSQRPAPQIHDRARAFALGRAHEALGEQEDARRAYNEVLTLEPSAAEAAIELALIDLSHGQIDNAIAFARQAVQAAPGNLNALLTLVRTLSVRAEDAHRANPIIKALLTKEGGAPEVHLLAGELSMTRGDNAAARGAFERALALEPDSIEALKRLVNLDVIQKRPDAARRRLEAAVAMPSPSVGVLLLAARFYAQQRDFDRAITLLKRVIDNDPSNLEAYSALGAIYVAQRRLPAARAELMELARLQPSVSTPTMISCSTTSTRISQRLARGTSESAGADPRPGAANNLAWLYPSRTTV